MNVLIIEDENRTAQKLSRLLTEIDESINIMGIIDSVEESIIQLQKRPLPDLIFSDIQLSDGISFSIFQEVQINIPVIFCTAFDEYLMQAFETNAISYILKPFGKSDIEKALEKYYSVRDFFKEKSNNSLFNLLCDVGYNKYKSTILLNQGEKIIPIKIEDIVFFYISDKQVVIQTSDNQKYRYSSTLDEVQKKLNDKVFFRVNRQFIINRNYVNRVEHYFNGKLVLKLNAQVPEPIIISRMKVKEFLTWLEA